MGPVYLFVLVATAVGTPEVGGSPGSQTVGYYETAAQCQTALIQAEKSVDRSYVRLDCRPIKATP